MTKHEAIQIIRLLAYIAEHDGTIDKGVINEAVEIATTALKEGKNERPEKG